MVPPNTLFWFKWQTTNTDYDICLAPQEVFDEWGASDAEGLTIPDEGFVILCGTLGFRRLIAVLFHELVHTMINEPSEQRVLACVLHCALEEATAREEDIVSLLGPKFADACMRNNFVNLPPLPEGHSVVL